MSNLKRPSREEVAVFEMEKIPVGGYQCGILGAEILEYSWGKVLAIKFDISEGDYKNYYTQLFKNSQFENIKYKGVLRINIPDENNQYFESQQKTFWRNIYAIEDSNNGYRFELAELNKLKGKKCGVVLFEKEWEYNGKTGMSVMPHSFRTSDDIKNNKFKIPKPKMLNNSQVTTKPINNDDFDEVLNDDDLPF